jgi:hypothetical protein
MRNTTKLKILLQKYTVTLNLDVDEVFHLRLTDKDKGTVKDIEGASYSIVLTKAYSYLLKVLKKPMEFE